MQPTITIRRAAPADGWAVRHLFGELHTLLPVSAQAHPATLDLVLDRVRGPDWTIVKLALIDERTRTRQPFLAERLARFADYVVNEGWDYTTLLDRLEIYPFTHKGDNA